MTHLKCPLQQFPNLKWHPNQYRKFNWHLSSNIRFRTPNCHWAFISAISAISAISTISAISAITAISTLSAISAMIYFF